MTLAATSRARPTGPRRPQLPPPVLVEALERGFGLPIQELLSLGGEFDQNLHAVTDLGQSYFVRVTLATPGSVDIAWQNSLLQHLAAAVPDLVVPRLVPATTGGLQLNVEHEGHPFVVRVMTWMSGRVLAEIPHHPLGLLRELGVVAGRLNLGLSGLQPPEGLAAHEWDLRRAGDIVGASLTFVDDSGNADNVRRVMSWFRNVQPMLGGLPQCVVHHDLNDANVLAHPDPSGVLHVSGVVDVGDSMHSHRATEVAIAAAYAMLRKDDPLAAAAAVVAGFQSVVPLTDDEIAVIYPLAATRLCMNAVTWTRRVSQSGSEYGVTRSRHTWSTLRQLVQIPPAMAEAIFRAACALPRRQDAQVVAAAGAAIGALFRGAVTVDAAPASDLFDELDWQDRDALRAAVSHQLGGRTGVLGHLQASLVWTGRRDVGPRQPATLRLGSTFLQAAGSVVRTPLPATVTAGGLGESDGGPLVLRHTAHGGEVHTCWWNLDRVHTVGDHLPAGHPLGTVGVGDVEPGFGTGVQVQLLTSAVLAGGPPPRRIRPAERPVWQQVCTDPAPGLGHPTETAARMSVDDVVAVRERHIARSQRNYYAHPMNLVRGRDVWLYDEDALGYLDSLNNVTHVGHAEPRVTAAATRQMRKLNTNSRFVYPQIATYAEKLVATLPDPLEVVFLVCSGSEANDLALRIARQVTGRQHVVNIDGAYHGNTGVVTGISPNRYKGPGGHGAPPTTHEVRIPYRYRGPYGYEDPDAGARYARDAAAVLDRIDADGRRPAAFIAESLMGSAGNIVFPDGYLAGAFAAARRVGALCISDEVQVGVGRLGSWWGFELQGVVPDIVTMGKPLGNGHPLAAVVTTRAIADAFDTGMKYFNTFGGNPVSCAVGEAVLDIVQADGLRDNALNVGGYFADALRQLQQSQPMIGDVRAQGLYLGVELVRDRTTQEPATAEAFKVTELTKDRGVVVFPNGGDNNVLKIKPPMTFRREHVDIYVGVLDEVLSLPELSARPK